MAVLNSISAQIKRPKEGREMVAIQAHAGEPEQPRAPERNPPANPPEDHTHRSNTTPMKMEVKVTIARMEIMKVSSHSH